MRRLRAISRFSGACLGALALSGCAATAEALKAFEGWRGLDAQNAPPVAAVVPDEAFGVYAQVTLHEEGAPARRFFALWRRAAAEDGAAGGGMIDEVELKNALGGTEARLRVDKSGALLEYRGRAIREGSGAELAGRVLGRELPVRALGFWMRGMPDPDAPALVTKNVAGRAGEIRQFGWVVQYIERGADALPKVMELSADGVRVRVSVRRWLS